MVEKAEVKETLMNFDDLLQCPVCYEIPSGQIFQCNEGHHVCGRCKMRLDVCPVCRALFFGTRNYAMEELIANFRKLRALKLGNSTNAGSGSSESSTPAKDSNSAERENDVFDDEEDLNANVSEQAAQRPPQACKGLFRCLCCKTGNAERLPAARLLNHLRYFHAPDLLEGQSENGEYLQAWQFSTVPGKLVTAVRVSDMGIFFLTIEINNDAVSAWLTMAASPWVAQTFNYTVTICGNDREAIFSDCVWSVRSCEGSLKKRGHCLIVTDRDARALTAPATISGKLSVRRTPADQLAAQVPPRAVMRIANRGNQARDLRLEPEEPLDGNDLNADNLEPLLRVLRGDVERLSQAFATLGREADALVRSEADIRSRIHDGGTESTPVTEAPPLVLSDEAFPPLEAPTNPERQMSRKARRRMRRRLRAALEGPAPSPASPASSPDAPTPASSSSAAPAPLPSSSGSSGSQPQTVNGAANKKKRRHRR